MESINEFFKLLFEQQPLSIVLSIIIIFLFLVIYATRTVSKQQTEDHEEKKMLIDLFSDLKGVINALTQAQNKRNETVEIQIQEQKTTNRNLSSLNTAFADYHSSLADTISVIFKNQITGRLDNVESKVNEVYDLVKNKPDCNDELLNRLNDIGKQLDQISKEKESLTK